MTSEVPPTSEPDVDSNRKLFYPDQEPGRHITSSQEPIVELVVLNKTLNEFVPPGFECLWLYVNQYFQGKKFKDILRL